ncbi:MAG: EtfAB:quinone oxidoreductase [Chloroflexi bacterium]|nr:EtfAB:quinone oxidoreductase [Chloroflexota bacterium]
MTTANATRPAIWPRIRDFLVYVLGQARTLKKPYPGIMHLLIFWGVLIQVVGTAIKMMQMSLFVPFTWPLFSTNVYLAYELIMDLAGIAIILGVVMAAFRRTIIRPHYMATSWDDVYALGLLFLLPSVGFVTEGMRLLVDAPAWAGWSPIGEVMANLLRVVGVSPAAVAPLHPYFFWLHVGLGLLFALSIPFTKMRHLVNTPLNIIFKTDRALGEIQTIDDIMEAETLGVGQVTEFSSLDLLSLDACLQCGRCEEVCPATISGMPYSPRALLADLRDSMAGTLFTPEDDSAPDLPPALFAEEHLWACTTCGACLPACPAFIRPPENVVDLRRSQVLMTGDMPKTVGETMRNLERQSNPWGMPPQTRVDWAKGLDVRELSPGDEVDVLFFVGCAGAFDDRNKQVTQSFVRLLNALEVDFGILGLDEMCCGETARRMGHEYLFQTYAEENIAAFEGIMFNKIITQCPHGLNTLRDEYPKFGGDYEVQHSTEFLAELIPTLNLSPAVKEELGRLTYHDSCYLGRYNDIYDQPRDLLQEVDVQPVEMDETREKSFCCGGGGGAMWLETDAETRINRARLEQALDVEADTIATACPFCMIMFDDAVRTEGLTEEVKVLDIVEVLERGMSDGVMSNE